MAFRIIIHSVAVERGVSRQTSRVLGLLRGLNPTGALLCSSAIGFLCTEKIEAGKLNNLSRITNDLVPFDRWGLNPSAMALRTMTRPPRMLNILVLYLQLSTVNSEN